VEAASCEKREIKMQKPVKDNSTTKQAGLPSTGIPYGIVNGTDVVKDSKVLKGVIRKNDTAAGDVGKPSFTKTG
jgi:hypothetical protein